MDLWPVLPLEVSTSQHRDFSCSWMCLDWTTITCAALGFIYTTDACAALGHVCTLCLSFTWTCLHYRPWAAPGCICKTVACAAPGLIYTTDGCAALGSVYTLRPELHLDLSALQSSMLHLGKFLLQGPELHLDVCKKQSSFLLRSFLFLK
jgi:hypothetical protein